MSERLQDIPASVAAVSGEELRRFNSLEALQSVVSGVTFKTFGLVTTVGIRGFGNRPDTQGSNTPAGIFQDGVYVGPFLNNVTSRIDVSRIEVAKGPQSTLYGRSTYIGAINVVTNDPTPTASGYLDVGAGGSAADAEGLWHVRGVLSGPLTSTLSARVFFLHENRDGYTYDPITNYRGYGYNRTAGRIKLMWKPTDALTIRLAGTLMHDDAPRGDPHSGRILPPLGEQSLFADPAISPIYVTGPDIWRASLARKPEARVNGQQGTLDIRYQTPIGELASLTDYTHSNTNTRQLVDTSIRNNVDSFTITNENRFSQELRLSGKTGRFTYLAGIYYLNTDLAFGNPGNTLDLNAPFAQLYPTTVLYDYPPGISKVLQPSDTRTRAYAGFAQLGFDLTDRLNLTAGIRQSRDDLSGFTESDLLLTSGSVISVVPKTYRTAHFNATTGSANLSYKISPTILAYASFARGDSPGGFNNGAAALINFAPQKVNAYELGFKSELLDRRFQLNLALFNNNYSDLQFFQAIVVNGVDTQVTLNAAKARGRGVDLDATAILSDHLRLNAQYTYQTSKFTAYNIPAPPAPQVNFVGTAVVRSPNHSFNGSATYTHDIGDGKFRFMAEESYTSSYNNDYTGVPAGTPYPGRQGVPAGVTTTQVLGLFPTPGYALTDLNASYTIGHWELSGYVRNLFNHQYIAEAESTDPITTPVEVPGEPRTIEVSLKYSF